VSVSGVSETHSVSLSGVSVSVSDTETHLKRHTPETHSVSVSGVSVSVS
jgi:hypothetical protein